MPLTCPCCRAANDAGPACRRCKADLSLLFAVDRQRLTRLADARRLAADGHLADALAAADDALALRRGPDAERFADAFAAYHVLTTPAPAAGRP